MSTLRWAVQRRPLPSALSDSWVSMAELWTWVVETPHQRPTRRRLASLRRLRLVSQHGVAAPSLLAFKVNVVHHVHQLGGWTASELVSLGFVLDTLLLELNHSQLQVKHVGLLPDVVHVLSRLPIFNDRKPRMPPILHILSKALPQRCQFRNFREILRNYCASHTWINDWLRALVLLSLGGYYPAATRMHPLTRQELYEHMCALSRDAFQEWATQNSLLVFYVIKEHLIFLMQFDPALETVACTFYDWQLFTKTTHEAMASVRCMWGTPACNRRTAIAAELHRLHTRNCKGLRRLAPVSPLACLKQTLTRLFHQGRHSTEPASLASTLALCHELGTSNSNVGHDGRTSSAVETWPWSTHTVRRVLQDVHPDGVQQWDDFVSALGDHGTASLVEQHVQRWDEATLHAVQHVALRLDLLQDVTLVPLPQHVLKQQYHALCRRNELHEQAVARVARAARFYVCLACRTFKAFVVSDAKTAVNVTANGHCKVAFDDETGHHFCSKHHNERQSGPRTKLTQRVALLHHLGLADARGCEHSRCVSVNLLGNLLLCFGHAYMLCSHCGSPARFHGHVDNFRCGFCGDQTRSQRCVFCEATNTSSRTWAKVLVYDDGTQCVDQRSLCPAHTVRGIGARKIWLKTNLIKQIQDSTQRRFGLC